MSKVTIEFPVGVGSHDGLSFRSYLFPLVMDWLNSRYKDDFSLCMSFVDSVALIRYTRKKIISNYNCGVWRTGFESNELKINLTRA